ncbi:hypothetical protein ACFL0Z_03010 [Patescibacteria group bacterium]
MRKKLRIMAVVTVVSTMSIIFLAGCCQESVKDTTEGALEKAIEKEGVNADLNLEEGKEGFTIDSGDTTHTFSSDVPGNWPDDVPIYPGAEVTSSNTSMVEGNLYGEVIERTSDNISIVGDWYKSTLSSEGWTETSSEVEPREIDQFYSKNGRSLKVTVSISYKDDSITYVVLSLRRPK